MLWVLEPPTFPPRKYIVGLIAVILCHLGVVIIHPWYISTKACPLLNFLRGVRLNLLPLVMVEAVLVLGNPLLLSESWFHNRKAWWYFWPYQRHRTASPLLSYWSRYYQIGGVYGYSLSVHDGDGICGVGNSTKQLSSGGTTLSGSTQAYGVACHGGSATPQNLMENNEEEW